MLTLTTASGAVPLKNDDYYIRELASGLDELVFTINIYDPAYQQIQEEASIREHSIGSNPIDYLVKAIDGGKDRATVKCQIDLDAWRSALVLSYNSGSKTIGQIVSAVAPTGWTVTDNTGLAVQRTIKAEGVTAFDVLEKCRSTFTDCTYRFDNVAHTVEIINMAAGQNLGAFATKDLNLKRNDYKGKSAGFATRLYAYGKDGLSFASINGGKPYVENHTYSSRVICAYWKDERYTIAANLLLDAQAKLDAMAVPSRSFDCDVVDLAAVDPQKYGFLSFPLFSKMALIDQTRGEGKVEHRVAERWRYPYYPEKNKVVLSTAAPRIQSQVTQLVQSVTNINSDWNEQQTANISALTEAILGANGGAVRLLDTNNDGTPDTLYIADANDPAQASNVWRFNYQGWGASQNGYNGPFALGATFTDGGTLYSNVLKVTNIDASNITTGTIDASVINVTNIDADNISGGTIDADTINVTHLNASNLTSGTLPTDRVGTGSLTGTKIATNTLTGGSSGNFALSTITTANTVSGINTNLGYAAGYGAATQNGTSTYPDYFKAGQIVSAGYFSGAGINLTSTNPANFSSINASVSLASGYTFRVFGYDVSWKSIRYVSDIIGGVPEYTTVYVLGR